MESHMVEAIGGTFAKIVFPRLYIHRHMACQWPNAGIMLASQKDLVSIGIEMLPFDMEILEVRMNLFCCW